ncbi:MAG: peptidyl-prolyl cis-trans isomerase [Candidatus Omnitrophica bacterium]|nr:peptidyl-prolyl cis-trans isomerase [Candidatus Omnitrophota bacterium]
MSYKKIGLAVFIIILAALIVALTWQNSTDKAPAGEIFGKTITAKQFRDNYDYTRTLAIFRFGELFPKFKMFLDLKSQTWDQILILEEAKRRKITATKKDLIEYLAKNKAFYSGEKFNLELYKRLIRQALKTDIATFEKSVLASLTVEKVFKDATSGVGITDEELLEEYRAENDKIKLSYALIPLDKSIKEASASDSEISDYYQKNKSDFIVNNAVNFEYVELLYPPDAGVQKKVETKYKGKAILDDFKKSKDLKKSAEKYKFQAKETGFISLQDPGNNIDWPYEQLIGFFEMPEGEIKEPVETEKGYLIVLSKKKLSEYTPSLDEVKSKIREKIIARKALDSAFKTAQEYIEKIKTSFNGDKASFDSGLTALSLKVEESEPLSKKLAASMLGILPDAEKQLFVLNNENRLSPPLKAVNGVIIAFLNEFTPFDPKKFSEEKQAFKEEFLAGKKEIAFKEFLDNLKKQAKMKTYTFGWFKEEE